MGPAGNIKAYIAQPIGLRRRQHGLQQTKPNLRFAQIDNSEIIGFIKESVAGDQCRGGGDRAQRRAARVLVSLRRDEIGPAARGRALREIEKLQLGASRDRVGWCTAADRARAGSRVAVPCWA